MTGRLLAALLALSTGTGSLAAAPSSPWDVASLSLPPLDATALREEDERRRAEGGPLRHALVSRVLVRPADEGSWESRADGRRVAPRHRTGFQP